MEQIYQFIPKIKKMYWNCSYELFVKNWSNSGWVIVTKPGTSAALFWE
jgi:hypothetical protein